MVRWSFATSATVYARSQSIFNEYAIMAGAYAHDVCGIENPRVGLLSIGEEDAKGTTTIKEARKLMRDEPQINFAPATSKVATFSKGVVI